jgi:beta-aspartyl-dipeptidase (metallo-type)
MFTIIKNARVYAPEDLGLQQVLIVGNRIAQIAQNIDLTGQYLQVIDAEGALLMPGFIDPLTHPGGGGGEGGFANRTDEISAPSFIEAGITSPIGALGTDSITRTPESLYGSIMGLREHGLAAFMYTGAYRVPAPTITNDIAKDLIFIDPVIGVGEVAISDHRGSQPSAEELRRLAADTSLGAVLSGKTGTVLVHVGDGDQVLTPLHDALQGSSLPIHIFYPTHCNRSERVFAEALKFASQGGFIDMTAATTPEIIAAGEIPALEAFERYLSSGNDPSRITFSSDAGGSLPLYQDGKLLKLTSASPSSLLEILQAAMTTDIELAVVVAALTRNSANALGLTGKGSIQANTDADLVLLAPSSGELLATMCGGRWLKPIT